MKTCGTFLPRKCQVFCEKQIACLGISFGATLEKHPKMQKTFWNTLM